MLQEVGRWRRKHPEATGRIGGCLFLACDSGLTWVFAKLPYDMLTSEAPLLAKIAVLGASLSLLPVMALKIADSISDIITGKHHFLGSMLVERFDQLRDRRNSPLQRASDSWAGEEARLLLNQLRQCHQPPLLAGIF
ncbi:MAG: hypothetical protein Q8Q91_02955 [Candidatus Daviesbacteria bacterium]|nr:hypothetical protein [Candidatus Daviesbacteria bacterium]